MAESEGDPTTSRSLRVGTRIACASSTYHAEVVDAMRDSARAVLTEAGLAPDCWREVSVPGAFELPVVAQALARRDDVDAVLCFGLVLRGETDHDRYISQSVANALQHVALATGCPVLFGVLTPNNLAQARARAGSRTEGGLDKGREVALAAIGALAALEEATKP